MAFVLSALAGAAVLLSGGGGVERLSVTKIDFVASYPVTDKVQFYRDQSGNPLPAGDGSYPPAEFDLLAPAPVRTVPHVVQRHGISMLVNVTFYNPLSVAVSGTWSCDWAIYTRSTVTPFVTYNLGIEQQDTAITIPATGSTTKYVWISGFPGFVCGGAIDIEFFALCEGGGTPISGGRGYDGAMYLVDAAPTGWMAKPWAEVLEKSTLYADGKSGKADCLKFSTKNLWGSGMWSYTNGDCRQVLDVPSSGNDGKFRLSEWASGATDPYADCRDVSSFLLLCTSSLGYTGTLTQAYVVSQNEGYVNFRTNDIRPIGQGSYINAFWDFHQFFEDAGAVYDACAAHRKDLTGANYFDNPVAWPRADYWQKQIGSTMVGLVNGLTGGPQQIVPGLFVPALVHGPLFRQVQLLRGVF